MSELRSLRLVPAGQTKGKVLGSICEVGSAQDALSIRNHRHGNCPLGVSQFRGTATGLKRALAARPGGAWAAQLRGGQAFFPQVGVPMELQ